jgi:hypothetical protein
VKIIVHVHHVDKDAFFKGNLEPNPEEVDLVFDRSPSFALCPYTIYCSVCCLFVDFISCCVDHLTA